MAPTSDTLEFEVVSPIAKRLMMMMMKNIPLNFIPSSMLAEEYQKFLQSHKTCSTKVMEVDCATKTAKATDSFERRDLF